MKKIVLFAALLFTSATVFSQEKALKQNGFWDNWFIQLQGGGSYMFSDESKHADFMDIVSPTAALSFGKFFSPAVGFRIQGAGWEAKSYLPDADKTYKTNYVQGNVDGLFSLTNIFLPYNPDRGFNLIALAGVGYAHGFKNDDGHNGVTNAIVPHAGLMADFRFSKAFSLNLEASGSMFKDNFNGQVGGAHDFDAPVNVMLGLTYRLGKSGFDLVDVADPAAIDRLNSRINQQVSQISEKDKQIEFYKAELAKKPAEVVKEVKEVKVQEQTEVLMNAVVVFKIGSAKLEQNQEINIYNAAKYLQENQSVNIVVTGYADRATGNPTINQRLSEERAKAVADILINKFNISPSRITQQASGDKEQPFAKDEWNRVVIFTAR